MQESLKTTRSTNLLGQLGNQATVAEHVTRFARLLSSMDQSEKAVSSSLNQGRFKALLAGNVSFLFQNCAKEHVKHPFKFVFSAVRLKLKCKFVIRGVNFQHLFPCFRYSFTFVQVYKQSLLVNRSKTALKTITTSL